MDSIASLPTETYSRKADTVEQLLDEAPLPAARYRARGSLGAAAIAALRQPPLPSSLVAGDQLGQHLLHPSHLRLLPHQRLPGAGAAGNPRLHTHTHAHAHTHMHMRTHAHALAPTRRCG